MAISHPVFEMRRSFEIKHSTTVFIAGPTSSGKTRLLLRALKESLSSPIPTRMIWVYGEWQADPEEIRTLWPKTEFVREMESHLYNSLEPDEHNMVIIDDKMSEEGGSGDLANLFTKGAHHRNLPVVGEPVPNRIRVTSPWVRKKFTSGLIPAINPALQQEWRKRSAFHPRSQVLTTQ